MLDIHSHVIPGVDDGAEDIDNSLDTLRQMHGEGVRHVIATPHLDGSLTIRQPAALDARLRQLDTAWALLRTATQGLDDVPRLSRGSEVKLDTPEPDVADPRIRLAGTDFVLVEFPFLSMPPHSARAIAWLRTAGYIPIVAHPERYHGLERGLDVISEWRAAGAYLQVNCGSLLGRYGAAVRRAAMSLFERGWVDYLASDHHARGTLPHRACAELLEELGGAEQLGLLIETNPARLLDNLAPLPIAPVYERSAFWSRITGVFR